MTILGHTESASATVVDAATATLHDGSARLTVSVTGNTDGTTVTGTGSGAIDFTDSALQLQMTVRTGGPEVPVEAVYEGGRVYESVPGLSTILPGKSWVSMDLSALQKADAQDPSAGGLGNNPAVILQMIAQPGNTVVSLGPSTVDGVAVAGYSVSVNPSRVGHELEQADLPAWMQQDVAGLQLHNVVLKVYVDNAGLLRSLVTQVSETAAATGNGTFDETLDFLGLRPTGGGDGSPGRSGRGTPTTVAGRRDPGIGVIVSDPGHELPRVSRNMVMPWSMASAARSCQRGRPPAPRRWHSACWRTR